MASNRSTVGTVQGYLTAELSNARFALLSDTNALSQNDVDIVAIFPEEVAFGDRPKLTTKVEFLIGLFQLLSVLLKSGSSDVGQWLENASYPIVKRLIRPLLSSWVKKVCSGCHQLLGSLSLNLSP